MVFVLDGTESADFVRQIKARFESRQPGFLLSETVARSLAGAVANLQSAGAELLTGGAPLPPPGWRFANTLLRVTAAQFLANPDRSQAEAFGNAAMVVIAADLAELAKAVSSVEGNLTGSIYTDSGGSDDSAYELLAPILRRKVGRLLNDKMPTGVAVTPAMNHGGPYPSTGHPGFTAVGIPASLRQICPA